MFQTEPETWTSMSQLENTAQGYFAFWIQTIYLNSRSLLSHKTCSLQFYNIPYQLLRKKQFLYLPQGNFLYISFLGIDEINIFLITFWLIVTISNMKKKWKDNSGGWYPNVQQLACRERAIIRWTLGSSVYIQWFQGKYCSLPQSHRHQAEHLWCWIEATRRWNWAGWNLLGGRQTKQTLTPEQLGLFAATSNVSSFHRLLTEKSSGPYKKMVTNNVIK